MSEDKRTFEANVGLYQGYRLQSRQAKGKKLPEELAPDGETSELPNSQSMPISQELILRLIKLLKES
jgi:hypothetical protein